MDPPDPVYKFKRMPFYQLPEAVSFRLFED